MFALSLCKESELLSQLPSKVQISLWAVHIPGKMIVIADLLTHQGQTLPMEWSINPEVTNHLFYLWGSPHVDLLATKWNANSSLCVSNPDLQALAVDSAPYQGPDLTASTLCPASPWGSNISGPALVPGSPGTAH